MSRFFTSHAFVLHLRVGPPTETRSRAGRAAVGGALAVLVALAGTATLVAQTPAADRPARVVAIDMVALDRQNNPVTDLKKEEVEVWIGGFRIPIDAFEAVTPGSGGDDGRLIVLLLDDILLPLPLVPRVREAARRFVTLMGPDDQMAIVLLDKGLMEVTSDRARLLKQIDDYNVRSAGVLRIDVLGAHVLDTIDGLARRLAEAPARRGVIVGIGASWVFDRPIPGPSVARDLRAEWTAAMRSLAIARASLYVIEPAGVGMAPVDSGSGGFADSTGGHAFVNTNDLTGAADQIMRETANYYLIGVADPPVQRNADLRELKVKVTRPNVRVRVREYLAGSR